LAGAGDAAKEQQAEIWMRRGGMSLCMCTFFQ